MIFIAALASIIQQVGNRSPLMGSRLWAIEATIAEAARRSLQAQISSMGPDEIKTRCLDNFLKLDQTPETEAAKQEYEKVVSLPAYIFVSLLTQYRIWTRSRSRPLEYLTTRLK